MENPGPGNAANYEEYVPMEGLTDDVDGDNLCHGTGNGMRAQY